MYYFYLIFSFKKMPTQFFDIFEIKKSQIVVKILLRKSKNCPSKIDVLHYRADMVKSGRLKYIQIMKWSA